MEEKRICSPPGWDNLGLKTKLYTGLRMKGKKRQEAGGKVISPKSLTIIDWWIFQSVYLFINDKFKP